MTPAYLLLQVAGLVTGIGGALALRQWTNLPRWVDAVIAAGMYLIVTYGIAMWRSGPPSTWPVDDDDY